MAPSGLYARLCHAFLVNIVLLCRLFLTSASTNTKLTSTLWVAALYHSLLHLVLEHGNIFDTEISHGCVATRLRYGRILIMTLVQIYCRVQRWKNFENRLAFGEVTDKSLMSCFLVHTDVLWQLVSISACLSSTNIKAKLHHFFMHVVYMAVATSYSGDVAIRYVHPVLWITWYIRIMALWHFMCIPKRGGRIRQVSQSINRN